MDNDDEAHTFTQLTKDVRIEAVEILNRLCEESIPVTALTIRTISLPTIFSASVN